ncbi:MULTISPECIES: alginate biosynthesis TPR repeat lipoprotein AlgK [Pseudomonas]|jgi:alginate biosynthesis protein AlgK|uniref:alginate biosynthesis TPR repeat lipoprotein AlgK n=1 Tax=Pseudomonas TaxID=286 RepID=UPI001F301F62|nr:MULTISPECIES: alginate biosynthesis TPR repeat lipoprotein AlgK [Pseudomonas]MDW3713055.1 alginate biosynthesis TPR repeat lipoprotein AlgK [Pseudomonas sp. 2023EL-01195]
MLGAAVALAGCAGLPDQRLANEALKRGDTATAERNYRQLADLGYVSAQVGLADLQVNSGDPEQMRQAEQIYRQAMDESPRAKARLGKLLARKPDATPAERQEAAKLLDEAFKAGEPSSLLPLVMLYLTFPQDFPGVNVQQRIAQWRADGQPQAELAQILFYRSQGTYDQHLGEIEDICKRTLAQADVCYVELATVYQKQGKAEEQQALVAQLMNGYHAGVIPAQRVDSVAQVLADAELGGKPDEGKAQEMLEEIAPAYPAAWVSLAKLLYEYPGLGDIDKMMEYLDHGREAALPRAELLLGRLYYEGKLLPQDPHKAEEHLMKAAPTEPAANYLLGQIYIRGYLGDIYPDKALDYLLSAARSGQINADFALGQMFAQGKGIQPNLVNAYVFSQLALPKNTPQATELAQAVEQQLQPAERARAEQLLRDERQLRGTALQDAAQMQAMQTP